MHVGNQIVERPTQIGGVHVSPVPGVVDSKQATLGLTFGEGLVHQGQGDASEASETLSKTPSLTSTFRPVYILHKATN